MPAQEVSAIAAVLRHELHEAAQPLSILQCRLEVGLLGGSKTDLEEAVRGAFDDLARLAVSLERLRTIAQELDTSL